MNQYCSLLDELIRTIKPFLETYIDSHKEEYLIGITSEESREEYIMGLCTHFIDGYPWTDDSKFRSNIINKAESFFRGFSKKSVRLRGKKINT